jgi:predicted N-acetyltransferase YhbS
MTEARGEIRYFEARDQEQVESLYAEVFGERSLASWRRRFQWQFERNPSTASRRSLLWVAEYRHGIVGFLASFPMRVSVGETELVTLCPCDLMISSEARGLGLGTRLMKHYLASGPVLANALQYSAAAASIYDRLGYAAVAAEPQMLRPYDMGALVSSRIRARVEGRSVPLSFAAGVAAPLIGLVANTAAAGLNSVRKPRPSRAVAVAAITEAGPEFDRLWHQLRPRFAAVVVRDRAFVQWRFLDDPLRRNTVLVARSLSGEALGYAAVMVAERHDVRLGYLLDVFADPKADAVIDALMAAALKALEADHVAAVNCLGLHPGIRRRVHRYLYLRTRSRENPARFLWQGEPALAPVVYEASSWHLTHADGDETFSL